MMVGKEVGVVGKKKASNVLEEGPKPLPRMGRYLPNPDKVWSVGFNPWGDVLLFFEENVGGLWCPKFSEVLSIEEARLLANQLRRAADRAEDNVFALQEKKEKRSGGEEVA